MSEKSRSDFTPVPKVSAVPPMRYETPLVPRNSISGRALVAVVAIMTFLASLTTGGVILVSQAATAWQATRLSRSRLASRAATRSASAGGASAGSPPSTMKRSR